MEQRIDLDRNVAGDVAVVHLARGEPFVVDGEEDPVTIVPLSPCERDVGAPERVVQALTADNRPGDEPREVQRCEVIEVILRTRCVQSNLLLLNRARGYCPV